MDIGTYKYKDPNRLSTVEDIMTEIDRFLRYIKTVAETLTDSDLRSKEKMAWFKIQTGWLKTLYGRLEGMVINN